MKGVADEIQKIETGIRLNGKILSIMMYADDIVLICRSYNEAVITYAILKQKCLDIGLKINVSKSQIVTRSDQGMVRPDAIPLEEVLMYTYLGIPMEINQRAQYMVGYSASRGNKARMYSISTISLARNSPCPALFAWRVWRLVAIPGIFYGCESVLIRENELKQIEIEQNKVARFILQVGTKTQTVSTQLLAGLESVQIIYWRRVFDYYVDLHKAKDGTWKHNAFKECLKAGNEGNYYRKVTEQLRWLDIESAEEIPPKLAAYSAHLANDLIDEHPASNQALRRATIEHPTRKSPLFGYTEEAKVYHEFIMMNAGLGNRAPLDNGTRITECPLCDDDRQSLNEIHILMQCKGLSETRESSGIQDFINKRKDWSASKLYASFWNDFGSTRILRARVDAAQEMRTAFFISIGQVIYTFDMIRIIILMIRITLVM